MDKFEIQIFDEITNYKEKFGFFTLRGWLFVVLIGACVIPTYIFLPKLIGEDITSWIVLLEAALIGFIGFVPVHNLPAEKIIPYWIRHYWHFSKPLKYMSLSEYQELKDSKKNKTGKPVTEKTSNIDTMFVKDKNTVSEPKLVKDETKETVASNKDSSPKDKKKLTKQEKDLMKARKKYGYLFKEDTQNSQPENDMQKNENIKKATSVNNDAVYEDEIIAQVDANKEVQEGTKKETFSSPIVDENEKSKPLAIDEKPDVAEKKVVEPIEPEESKSKITAETSDEEDLDSKLNSLSDEEKRLLLKLLGK